MDTSSRDVDPSVVVAREGRKGQVWAAAITAAAGVAVAIGTYLAGLTQGESEETAAAAVTTTVTATVTVTASPEPGGGERSQPDSGESGQEPAGDPVFLAALTPKGTAPIKGRQRISGRWYNHSLGFNIGCGVGTSNTVYAIGEGLGRFQATVGVTGGRSDSPVTFTVFADVDEDERGDRSEELGVAAAVPGRSATLDVPLDGATRIILRSNASLCAEGMAVWADPRVF